MAQDMKVRNDIIARVFLDERRAKERIAFTKGSNWQKE